MDCGTFIGRWCCIAPSQQDLLNRIPFLSGNYRLTVSSMFFNTSVVLHHCTVPEVSLLPSSSVDWLWSAVCRCRLYSGFLLWRKCCWQVQFNIQVVLHPSQYRPLLLKVYVIRLRDHIFHSGRYQLSNSNSISANHQCTYFPADPFRPSIHIKAWWLVRTANRILYT